MHNRCILLRKCIIGVQQLFVIHLLYIMSCITEVYRMYNHTFVIHQLYKLDVYWMYNKCILMKFWVLFHYYTLVIHVSLYNECITNV